MAWMRVIVAMGWHYRVSRELAVLALCLTVVSASPADALETGDEESSPS